MVYKTVFKQGRSSVHLPGYGAADVFESRKVPFVWEVNALLWFNGLDSAIVALQKDAFVIGLFLE